MQIRRGESTGQHDSRNDIFDVWHENHGQLIQIDEMNVIPTLSQAKR
jgi:hypothetical protein